MQKTTLATVLPTTSSSTGGLALSSLTNYAIGDKGCLPILGATTTQQSASAQTVIAFTGTAVAANVQSDVGSMYNLLCFTSGVCCFTSYCNAAPILIQSKLVFAVASIFSYFYILV